ncbi:MAG: diadenylate cyclase CdaA [Deferribacteraceae bacterium]|nr:diadenylate cyclase CdaA [Deferribacteraceae bacterium]
MDFIKNILFSVTVIDFLDMAIMSFIVYKVLQMMRGTRVFYMVIPIVGVIIMMPLTQIFGLRTTNWMLSNFTGYLLVMLVILFQPELRRALLVLGESRFLHTSGNSAYKMVEEVVRTATILANRQIGALIVFQRKIDLTNIVTLGQKIDSEISRDLLLSLFIPYSPLHDGAVIINGSRLTYAACILPLTKREDISKSYGTRHRAAFGITEETDAVAVVVSEERGVISMVVGSIISAELDAEALKTSLIEVLGVKKGD